MPIGEPYDRKKRYSKKERKSIRYNRKGERRNAAGREKRMARLERRHDRKAAKRSARQGGGLGSQLTEWSMKPPFFGPIDHGGLYRHPDSGMQVPNKPIIPPMPMPQYVPNKPVMSGQSSLQSSLPAGQVEPIGGGLQPGLDINNPASWIPLLLGAKASPAPSFQGPRPQVKPERFDRGQSWMTRY